jgi:hypothetical protein
MAALATANTGPLEDVTAGVIGAVIEHFAGEHPVAERVACIGLDNRTLDELLATPRPMDPSPEVLAQLRAGTLIVEPLSACSDDDPGGFRVRGVRRPGGFLLTVGKLKRLAEDSAEVPVRYCCWLGWGTAQLVMERGRWRVKRFKGWAQS